MKRAASRYQLNRRYTRYLEHVILSVVILALALVPTIYQAQFRYRDQLQMWFFDIGQGDATFIQTPDGTQILVDGGPDDTVLQKLAQVMLPWDRTIDAIVITHPDADHITGLVSVLDRYQVKTIIETGAQSDTSFDQALVAAIEREGAEHCLVSAGDRFAYGTLELNVVWPERTYLNEQPEETNATSIVLLAFYGGTSLLLTGDAEAQQEHAMLGRVQDIDVLKAGHHGSQTSSSVEFLETINPEITTISDGVDNRYGHPHPVVLKRLSDIGSVIYRTDEDGDLLLLSSGGEPTVQPAPLLF